MKLVRNLILGFFAIAFVLLVAVGGYVYWMFYDNRAPNSGVYEFDLETIRALSKTEVGELAKHIEVEVLSHSAAPRIAMAAGTNWDEIDLVRTAFLVRFSDYQIMIEAGQSPRNAMMTGAHTYDDAAWDRVLRGLTAARKIVVTHGHIDHSGGLIELSDNEAVLAASLLSKDQIDSMKTGGLGAVAFTPKLQQTEAQAIAPGIVLIPAPGHTPGSQWVYVQLRSGQELLFVGDTASLIDNVELVRPRSRYVMSQMSGDDRAAVFAQTKLLNDLSANEPGLILVPGHDGDELRNIIETQVMISGFRMD